VSEEERGGAVSEEGGGGCDGPGETCDGPCFCDGPVLWESRAWSLWFL